MFPFAAAIPFVAPLVEKGIDALSGGSDDKSSDKSDGGDGGFNPMDMLGGMDLPVDLPFDLGGITSVFSGGDDDKGDGGGGLLGIF